MALVSRSADRHADYLSSLAVAGVDAAAFTADAANPESLRHAVEATRARFGRIDVGHYGLPAPRSSRATSPSSMLRARRQPCAACCRQSRSRRSCFPNSPTVAPAYSRSRAASAASCHRVLLENPDLFGRFAANAESRRSRRHGVAPLHRTNRGGSGDQRAGRMIARGVVDRTGSPNFAATPSLYAT